MVHLTLQKLEQKCAGVQDAQRKLAAERSSLAYLAEAEGDAAAAKRIAPDRTAPTFRSPECRMSEPSSTATAREVLSVMLASGLSFVNASGTSV
jgi:hypothetical protein